MSVCTVLKRFPSREVCLKRAPFTLVSVWQVANKERELQQALQKQEKYQQAVQELTAKMERAQISLARTPASVAADIDTQLKDYKVSVLAEKK